jgi:flavin-dependent dehydrogenase
MHLRVTVLGAGPAGSTVAYYLAKGGISAELIDRVDFPRDKPCAGGLFNPLGFEKMFPHIKKLEGKDLFRVQYSGGRYSFLYESETPLLRTILRKDLDLFLLERAKEAGARFSVQRNPSCSGEVVIRATGVRRISDYDRAGICMEYDFPTDREIDTIYIHYGFCGIKGYCWLYPKYGYANIGIGAYLPQKDIKAVYESYINHLERQGVVSVGERRYRARIIPFSPVKDPCFGGSVCVGDAAGFVRPGTGEGIYFAMLSGKIAARMIIENRSSSWYKEECNREFGRYLRSAVACLPRGFLNRVLSKSVRIGGKDEKFRKLLAEDFFRLEHHSLTGSFLRNMLK